MSEQLEIMRKKRNQRRQLFREPKTEESEERYNTSDEGDSGVIAREISVAMREQVRKVSEQFRIQEKMFELENRKLDEKSFTARNSLTNSELGNVAKVVLSDQTITLGKGSTASRKHRKIAWGLWHNDTETTTEITLSREGSGH